MSEATEETPPKRQLSREQIEKMQAGRREAKARREREQREAAERAQAGAPEEKLVRTNSTEIRNKQQSSGLTLDEIAKRHAQEKADAAAEPQEPEDIDADEIARGTEFVTARDEPYTPEESYNSGDEVWAPEEDPLRRDKPTVGEIQLLRDDSDEELTTFEDLMREYGRSIEIGQAYIAVHRKSPSVFDHVRIKGVQRAIRQQMTLEDFKDIYGGGEYELVVYGPSKRGGHKYDPWTGAIIMRKLTKPIALTIPAIYPPSLEAALEQDEYDDGEIMENLRGAGRLPLHSTRRFGRTTADAKIHEAELTHEERQERRQEEREEKRKREAEEKRREEERRTEGLVQELTRAHERQVQMLEQQMENMRQEFREQRAQMQQDLENRKPGKTEGEIVASSISQIVPAMLQNSSISSDQAKQIEIAAQKDKERLIERHKEEVDRHATNHQRELDRMRQDLADDRRSLEDRLNEARKNADERVREMRTEADARVREVEKRAADQIGEVRQQCELRITDMQRQHDSRVKDIDRGHQTEIRQLKESHDTRMESMKSLHSSELSQKDAELSRIRDELVTVREKANRPLSEQLEEYSETAAALGYTKSDGSDEPKDWKQMLADSVPSIVEAIPRAIDAVQVTLRERQASNQQQQAHGVPQRALPPPVQGRQGSIASQRLAFATEDGPEIDFGAEMDEAPPPVYPGQAPPGPSRRPVALDGTGRPRQTGETEPLPPPPPEPEPVPPPPQGQMVRANPEPQPRPQAQPAAQRPQVQISDEQIVEQSKMFEGAFDQGASPEHFVDAAIQQHGTQIVGHVIRAMTPERIVDALEQADPASGLLSRDGKAFLRQVWAVAGQRVSG